MKENTEQGKDKYWKSLDQWRKDPSFQELIDNEFVKSPLGDEAQEGWARRDFIKLMGASLALGSFGCVRRPVQKIIPYINRPEEIIPGISNYYASSFLENGEVTGLVVKTREGRPIKVEGNEFFPEVGEALHARGQAHLLSLYDPDRLTKPIQNLVNPEKTNKDTISTDWSKADRELKKKFDRGGVFVLSGPNPSETSRALINQFVSSRGGKYYEWDPVGYSQFKESFSSLGGGNTLPRYRLDKADLIFSMGTDFLATDYSNLANSRAWGRRRDASEGEPLRLVQAEALMSLTGTNADKRIILCPSEYLGFMAAVASHIGGRASEIKNAYSSRISSLKAGLVDAAKEMAKELIGKQGKSVVMAFGIQAQTEDYAELQKLSHYLNSALGNDGATIDYSQAPVVSKRGSEKELMELLSAMERSEVKTLIIHDVNLIYSFGDLKRLRKALKKVNTLVYTGDKNDETGSVSNYVLPDDHSFEKWNEYESFKNIYSIQQPTISPLYDTRAFEQSLLVWMGEKGTWFDLIKATWKRRFEANRSKAGYDSFDSFWVALLQKGVWDLSGFRNSAKSSRSFSGSFSPKQKGSHGHDKHHYELVVYQSVGLGDGKYANVSWLQEFPDPVSKIVWDNYLTLSPHTAEELKVKDGDVLSIKGTHGEDLELPAFVQPGQDDHTVGMKVGYGRKGAGKVCDGIGVNAFSFVHRSKEGSVFAGEKVTIKKLKKHTMLANVQGHHSMESRQIVTEASYNEYKEDHSAGIHRHKVFSLWPKHKYTGNKWAMSVDLSKCTGCSACVVACQSENNIPVVGKKHVLNGREMHWIRIDRYYSGSPSKPRTVHQPVMCQHCDNAPCETVCPVLATVHSDEGTNDMVYNRCVGTRYCSNNCPYKVRRFNWFNYSKIESPLKMALNPEVTVRSRGVMEKCTFCIHKIRDVKSKLSLEGKKVQDGDVRPACEMTCPTKAIVFGDMNNEESRVSKKFKDERTYSLLEEINVVPSVRYMSRIWNTDEKLVAHHGSAGHGEEEHHGSHESSDDHGNEHGAVKDDHHKEDSHHKDHKAEGHH